MSLWRQDDVATLFWHHNDVIFVLCVGWGVSSSALCLRGTTDTIFVVHQLQEKYIAANNLLYFAFFDIEKAFDRVPREVLLWALRSLRFEEWALRVIQDMYSNAQSHVQVDCQYSEDFGSLGVGVHQGSVLNPLFFILVLGAFLREFRTGVLCELLMPWCSSWPRRSGMTKWPVWDATMSAKHGDQITPNYSGSTTVTVPFFMKKYFKY